MMKYSCDWCNDSLESENQINPDKDILCIKCAHSVEVLKKFYKNFLVILDNIKTEEKD